jgi:selenocysteine lyase/cysteine desulfurase
VQSAITAFHYTRPIAEVRAAFEAAKVDVTIRDGHVRVSVALLNNAADIERLLAVAHRIA